MMKHFSLFIILFSFLFVACNKSDLALLQENEDVTTFTLSVEQEATPAVAKAATTGKTATTATPATRTATTIAPVRYIMEVWSETGDTPENVFEGGTTHRAEIKASNGSSFTATLDKSKAYTCLFWADDNATFDAADLKAISLKAGKEIADIAYFANIKVEKGRNPAVAVTLKRAVAKVVLVEADKVKITDNLALAFSDIYPQFNVLEGGASGTPASWSKTINPAAATGPLATLYFLAKAEPQLTELTFVYAADAEKTVSNIPYQQNYATSIKGEYSSIGWLHFNVTTSEEWGTPDNEVEFPTNVMRMTINTTKNTANTADKTFILPLAGTPSGYDLTVDWGDSQKNTFAAGTTLAQADMTHTYASAGEYTITISSSQLDPAQVQMPKLDFYNNYRATNNNPKKLISLNSPLLNMGANLSFCFYGCSGLTEIPATLFEKNTAATNLSNCFSGCKGLTGAIPATLFEKNIAATNFWGCFNGCTGLTSEIPATLFEKNIAATDFSDCFQGCTNLTGAIPATLFAKNTAAINFSSCFNGCTKLTPIPANLFAANTKVTSFSYCFNGCTGLTGTIPAGLFAANIAATDFSLCFNGCTGLTGEIPATLFEKNTAATDFSSCFRGCTGLTGEIPAGLFTANTKATNFKSCFQGCKELTGEIPATLFEKNIAATDFSNCFQGCTELTGAIPATLFDKNTAATSFTSCFNGCTGLTGTIPATLFEKNTLATNFSSCFYRCTGLTGEIPAGLFAANTKVTDFSFCFDGCTKLVLNADIFCTETVENKTNRFTGKRMNFSYCFRDCGSHASVSAGLGGTAPALWDYSMASSDKMGCFYNVTKVTNVNTISNMWK